MNGLFRSICAAAGFASCITLSLPAQQGRSWRLVEEWRVGGGVTGADAFGRVVAIRALPAGGVVVVEGKDQQVHIFDAKGKVVKTIGRRGGGPGEFQEAKGVIISPKGEIVINDGANGRLTFLSTSGDLIRTQPNAPWGPVSSWDAYFDAQGRLNEFSRERRRTWTADFSRADESAHAPCANIPAESNLDLFYRIYQPNGSYMSTSYPFTIASRGSVNAADGSRWIGEPPDYSRIRRVAFGTCDVVGSVSLSGPPIPVPTDQYERIRAIIRKSAQGQTAADAPNPDKIRKTLPAFESLTMDAANQLWVERLIAGKFTIDSMSLFPKGPRRFEVFAPSGAQLASVDVPPNVKTPRAYSAISITNDHFFAFITDDDDIPYLVSYRIVR